MEKYQRKMDKFRQKYQLSFQQQHTQQIQDITKCFRSRIIVAQAQIVEALSITLIQDKNSDYPEKMHRPFNEKCVQSIEGISYLCIPMKKQSHQIKCDQLLDDDCDQSILSIQKKLNSTTKFEQQATEDYVTIKKQKLRTIINSIKLLKKCFYTDLKQIKYQIEQQIKKSLSLISQQCNCLQSVLHRKLNSRSDQINELKDIINSKNLLVYQSENLLDYYQKQLNKQKQEIKMKMNQIIQLRAKIKELSNKSCLQNKMQVQCQNQVTFDHGKNQDLIDKQYQSFTNHQNNAEFNHLCPSKSTNNIWSWSVLKNKQQKKLQIERIKNKLNCLRFDIERHRFPYIE